MATFVSLVTCYHCPVVSSRRGLIYRDSLSALSRNLRAPMGPPRPPRGFHYHPRGLHRPPVGLHRPPVGPHRPPGPQLPNRHHCRLHRPELPECIALARSEPSGSMKHLVLGHLRKLLTLSPARRGLRRPG